jgi:hypothetical protein
VLTDEELESTLRRFAIGDPPPGLRASVLSAAETAPNRQPGWWWGPLAAAAILVLWLSVTIGGGDEPVDPLREAEVALAAEILGGGREALVLAEWMVPERPAEESWRTAEQLWSR